jgi:hypothetical protein
LREATFRGARVAVVCPIGDPKIALAAIFDGAGAGTPLIPTLTTANIQVNYQDSAGNNIVNPGAAGNLIDVRYVNVQIVNFSHDFLVPALAISFTTDSYPATLPTESLGISREGAGAVAC